MRRLDEKPLSLTLAHFSTNRKNILLVALSNTENDTCTSNSNLIDLQGQNNGLQPQFTVQPQLTSFNPYQQQAQQEAMQVRVPAIPGMRDWLDRHCRPNGQGSSKNG